MFDCEHQRLKRHTSESGLKTRRAAQIGGSFTRRYHVLITSTTSTGSVSSSVFQGDLLAEGHHDHTDLVVDGYFFDFGFLRANTIQKGHSQLCANALESKMEMRLLYHQSLNAPISINIYLKQIKTGIQVQIKLCLIGDGDIQVIHLLP